MARTYGSIAEIKAANEAAGRFWFSPDTMRFFRSHVEPGVMHGRYFVSSEQMDDDSPRVFKVRVAEDDGGIDTLPGEYASARAARAAIAKLHV